MENMELEMQCNGMEKNFVYKGIKARIVLNSLDSNPFEEDGVDTVDWFCGYFRMEKGTDIDPDSIPVHGDVTFDQEDEEDYRWLGFDCMHLSDDIVKCNYGFVENELVKMIDYYLENKVRVFEDE